MALAVRMAASISRAAIRQNETSSSLPCRQHIQRSDRSHLSAGYKLVPSDDLLDDASRVQNRPARRPENEMPTGTAHWQDQLHYTLSAPSCQMAVAALIIANAVIIGAETDEPERHCWILFEHLFLSLFVVEITLKVISRPSGFFNPQDAEFAWNLFDASVVSLGLFDSAVTFLSSKSDQSIATAFRIIRLARILRILRLVRFMKQLYMLVFGFGLAAVAVFWVTVMMTLVLYVSAIVLVRTLGRIGEDDENYEILQEHFGSLMHAMLTLFTLMAVPDLDPFKDVLNTNPAFLVFCVLYIIFGSFGLIGLLTGVIMESMYEKNDVRREEGQKDAEEKRNQLANMLEDLFDQSPKTPNGELTIETVAELVPEITSLLRLQGYYLTPDDKNNLAEVIDVDGSGTVSRSEFSEFIIAVIEGVRPMMTLKVNRAVTAVLDSIEDASQRHTHEIANLAGLVVDALTKVDHHVGKCHDKAISHTCPASVAVPQQLQCPAATAEQEQRCSASSSAETSSRLSSRVAPPDDNAGQLTASSFEGLGCTMTRKVVERVTPSVRSAPESMRLSEESQQGSREPGSSFGASTHKHCNEVHQGHPCFISVTTATGSEQEQ